MSRREETIVVPPDVRGVHSPRRFALFALVALSALVLFSQLVCGVRTADAVSARFMPAGAGLAVSPTSLTTCRHCRVTVINQSPTRGLTWSAISRGVPGVTINPAGGTLQRKGQVTVTITVPSTITCPANDTIIFSGPTNSVNVPWSCQATPTPTATPSLTPSPATPAPTPTTSSTPSPTSAVGSTPTTGSPGPTPAPTATSVPQSGVQHTDGNPPPTSGSQDSSVPSVLLSVAALLLALCAFTLYLMSPGKASLSNRLLSLMLPAWFLRRLDQNR